MLNDNQVEIIKNKYPIGTRIRLHHMADDYGVPDGTLGTVDFVDGAGQIQITWDNGQTLALIESEDTFEIIEKSKIDIDIFVKM